jgi:hypothetical protein
LVKSAEISEYFHRGIKNILKYLRNSKGKNVRIISGPAESTGLIS